MSARPPAVERHLAEILMRGAAPAYLQVTAAGEIVAAGGALARYGLGGVLGEPSVERRLPFLHGVLPIEGEPVHLPSIALGHGVVADVHAWPARDDPDADGWILLLDTGAAAEEARAVHQRVNELALMRGRVARLERQIQAQLVEGSDKAVLGNILRALGAVVLEVAEDGRVDAVGETPAWFQSMIARAGPRGLDLWPRFPFLEHFLEDAQAFWAGGDAGFLRSGVWSEQDAAGAELHLEALATRVEERHLLVIRESAEFQERQSLIQRAREGALGSRRALEDERKQASDLREVRDDLERRVAERTSELSAAVVRLESEVVERRAATDRLVANQRRLRDLTLDLVQAEEQERRRVAVGLHDHLGQNLALTKIRLSALLAGSTAPEVVAPLEQIRTLVEQVIRATRSLTFELGSPVRYELGLQGALENLAERFQEQHGIETTVEDDGADKPLSEEVETVLFQTVRELLHNVVKHAEASQVRIEMRRAGDRVQVVVEDDGVGFDTDEVGRVGPEGGFGLFNVRERIQNLGGESTLASRPGAGTRAILSVTIQARLA